jgi:hypothetical protein
MFHPASLIRRLAAVPVLLASFTALTATPARAQLRMEVIPFESVTLTGQQILLGESKGAPATIAGELRLPRGGTDRVPVVVLVHGIGGLMMNVDEWARALNSWGFGAFILDNLSGRGITGMTPDDFRLSELARRWTSSVLSPGSRRILGSTPSGLPSWAFPGAPRPSCSPA